MPTTDNEAILQLDVGEYCADITPFNDGEGAIFSSLTREFEVDACSHSVTFAEPYELVLNGVVDSPTGCCGTVATSNDKIVVGAGRVFYQGQNRDTRPLFVYTADESGGWQHTSTLHESKDNSVFAMDGKLIVAANRIMNEVIVYELADNGAWQSTQLQAGESLAANTFGYSVAVEGNRIVVGATNNQGEAHAAYVFDREQSGLWGRTARLEPAGQIDANTVWFGAKVALSGDRIVVAARGRDSIDASVHLFEKEPDTNTWKETLLIPRNEDDRKSFARSVAINKDVIAVGAPDAGDVFGFGYSPGIVFLYKKNEQGEWEESQVLASDVQNNSRSGDITFGQALKIKDNLLIVGSAGQPESGSFHNSVYLYALEEGRVTTETILTYQSEDHSFGDFFDFDSGRLVVPRFGRFFDDYAPGVFVYEQ